MSRLSLRPLLLTLLAPLLLAQDPPPAPAAAPFIAPAVLTLPDGTYGLILIPDLPRLSQHCAQIAAVFQGPGPAQPTISDSLGGMLGDPGLTNLAHTPIVGVIVPGVPAPGIAFIIPCVKPQPYLDALAQLNMTGQAVGTLAVVSNNAAAIQAAVAIAGTYGKVIAIPSASDLSLVISPKRLATAYGPFIKNMAMMLGANLKGMSQVVNAEVAGALTVSADVDALQTDLSWTGTALAFDQTLVASQGGVLAKDLISPAHDGAPSAASQLDNRPSFLAVAGRINPSASCDYIASVMSTLATDPALTGIDIPTMATALKNMAKAETGMLAMQVTATKSYPFSLIEAFGCTDPTALEAGQKVLLNLVSAMGSLRALGVTMSFDSAVRTVGKTPVDRYSTVYAAGKTPPIGAQPPTELAFTDRFMLLSQDPAVLDAMILGTTHGMTLQAQTVFPATMDGYGDIDPDALAASIPTLDPGFVPPANLSQARSALCWSIDNGKARFHLRVPIATLNDLAAIIAATKAQHAQQGGAPVRAQPASAPTF